MTKRLTKKQHAAMLEAALMDYQQRMLKGLAASQRYLQLIRRGKSPRTNSKEWNEIMTDMADAVASADVSRDMVWRYSLRISAVAEAVGEDHL